VSTRRISLAEVMSWAALTEPENDIRTWINEVNKDPRPFAWTKTADEILETLAAYCSRVNEPGL
jgi:hypothetical protein